ncbi:MAG: hypothetical protein A2X36_08840 [Elusimicrobia bacterium GWA2_69_24]|nr:MAG: hypothetical protein A2X36_08840 [Elusimicrobia bacterium GWA2_69_24]HBL19164.1 hypothetical protein [Elusimicrobiota bacterium]
MTGPALLALLASLAGASRPAAAQPSAPAYAAVPQPKDWMRLYPMRQYGAYWHLQLSVPAKRYAKVRAQALKTLEKAGARHTVPVDNSISDDKTHYQQFSVELGRVQAAKALEALRKSGRVGRLAQDDNRLSGVEAEVPAKLAKLRSERERLAGAPASAEAVGEILAHLSAVQAAYDASRDRVLLNIVIEGER